jgi:hypothetical protein
MYRPLPSNKHTFYNINVDIYRRIRNWDSSLGVVLGYRLDGLISIPGNAKIFSSPQCPD